MIEEYFSDRELGPRRRTEETISAAVWGGIVAIAETLIDDGSFGQSFPDTCYDGPAVVGTKWDRWRLSMRGENPDIEWPWRNENAPVTGTVLDFVEFCHRHVSKAMPIPGSYHEFFRHHHLEFDRAAGQADFRERINRLFARNGLAYELQGSGQIVRLAPTVMREALLVAVFQTGDSTLDTMLETARAKFLDPNPAVRHEALKELWDAWERLKTVEAGSGKKARITALLEKAAPEPRFRAMLDAEAKVLTEIGNTFHIRHSETTQTPLQSERHVDYLFHRLFSLVWLLLRATNRTPT
jgi:hypothetical protein